MTITKRTKRITAAVVIAAAIILSIWAFATRAWETTPSFSDVSGVWQRGDSDMRMTIYSSGKISFSNVPEGILDFQGGKHDNTTRPISAQGKLDPFWNYGWFGGVSTSYSLPKDQSGPLYSRGNGIIGYQVYLLGGNDFQYTYNFHRIAATP